MCALQLVLFGSRWRKFIRQFLLRVPTGARRLNLWNLSWIFGVLQGRLKMTVSQSGKIEYGKVDEAEWTQDKFEEIQMWLLDPDNCATDWPELLRIRRENVDYVPPRMQHFCRSPEW